MRFIALDVHRDFCEVAISEDDRVPLPPSDPDNIRAPAGVRPSLASEDHVALEVTGNALAIARIFEPHG